MKKRRRTKIVCTLGPACEDEEILYQMILAGMDVARFNFSHGTQEEHGKRMELVRRASARAKKRIGIMLDTRGPEIRLGNFEGGQAFLKKGDTFVLTTHQVAGNSKEAYVSLKILPQLVSPGSVILLDDGNIQLEVLETGKDKVVTKILNDGIISDRKKVSLPRAKLEGLPALDEKDKSDIFFGASQNIDFVAASFVRSADDVLEVRHALEEAGSDARIIAKIESVQGVEALDEILKTADGLMVARGDLGVEYPPEDIPVLQKRMIMVANRLGKPVITATQMLESMIEHPRPTRAEASDVANAIFDGTDAVMLSAETALGKYPVEAVKFMARIALKAEEVLDQDVFLNRFKTSVMSNITEAVSRSAVIAAADLGASAIITPTESGYTARMVSRFRPKIPVYAVTPHDETRGWLTCVWGVETVIAPKLAEVVPESGIGDVSDVAIEILRREGLIEEGALCVVTKGVPQGVPGTTNVMEIRTVGRVVLKGTGIGQKAAVGEVVVALTGEEANSKAKPGCILVAPSTDRSYAGVFSKVSALVLEQGGLTSDGAIAALQMNVPAVVGAQGATRTLKDGDIVTVDAARGVIYLGVAKVK